MSRNKLKIFISGANGFLGRNLIKQLIKNYNLLTPNKKKLNLTNNISLKNYLKLERPEIIIHLASSTKFKLNYTDEKKNQITNTLNTTKNLVNCINSECKLIIFFGSIEEYGLSIIPFKENQIPKPISMYGKYKYKSYLYVSKLLKKKN